MSSPDFSAVFSMDSALIDQYYEQFKTNPENVSDDWKYFFRGLDFAVGRGLVPEENIAEFSNIDFSSHDAQQFSSQVEKEFKVFRLIQSYRARGHLISKTNPLRPRKNREPHLELADYGLTPDNLQERFICGHFLGMGVAATLTDILTRLQTLYAGPIGYEFMHINDTEVRRWFRDNIEHHQGPIDLPLEQKKRILQKLNEAAVFENFLDTKYVGQKRFSLEGGENTICALDAAICKGAELGIEEVVIGMAHRGRLNVLANILGKTYDYIFNEFEGQARPDLSFGDGDVKYHLGFSSEFMSPQQKKVYLKLMPNPSHLEAVGPVVVGFARAQRDQLYRGDSKKILPIIIHGDAAVAGQGIVYEILQMSQLKGYRVGGTIHFIINNQIGFTTNFDEARTSTYCTSVAKTVDAPIIHVNGDDAEAVVHAMELCLAFRQKFERDIFLDMVCYRKHGHNESDEPRFTQPQMYELIKAHLPPREVYVKKLVQGHEIEVELAQKMEQEFKNLLQERFNLVKQKPLPYLYQKPELEWSDLRKAREEDFHFSPPTGASLELLNNAMNALVQIPATIIPISKAMKLVEERKKKWFQDQVVDWSMAELLAYGSLLQEGVNVRLSGQDCIRGTFSHRHAEVYDQSGKASYNGLNELHAKNKFFIYNSLLSEYAVLAFEYGYSLSSPSNLVIWEAQFGDFANGAQTVIDQFLSSGESKWQKMSGLVCLLPHGYEGQGPEHSSARPERFLQLAAELNLIISNATTPANFFHLLRRQQKWHFRKPLIVMTPKSLLRHPLCVSRVDELVHGNFQELLYSAPSNKHQVKRLIFCSGKIYYDLNQFQIDHQREDVLIIRLEQLYPLPMVQIQKILKEFLGVAAFWVQEEPKNMGAWSYLCRYAEFSNFTLIARKASASTATGFAAIHHQEQAAIVQHAFNVV